MAKRPSNARTKQTPSSAQSANGEQSAHLAPSTKARLKNPIRGSAVERIRAAMDWNAFPLLMRPLVLVAFSFCVQFVLTLLVYALYSPQFNTRDDTAMMLLSSGSIIALQPTEYLLFTNVLIGSLLKTLYAAQPDAPWYAWYVVATLFCGHWAALYAALKRFPNWLTLGLYVLYFLACGAFMFLQLQFTMAASLAAVGGVALMHSAFHERDTQSHTTKPLWRQLFRTVSPWLGVVLVGWSAMVRWESFLLVLACALPLFIVELLFTESRIRAAYKLVPFAFAAVIGFSAQQYHLSRYQALPGENPIAFNNAAGEFLDFRLPSRTVVDSAGFATMLSAARWNTNDYEMLMNWFFVDEERYSLKTLNAFLQAVRTVQEQDEQKRKSDALAPLQQQQNQTLQDELRLRLWSRFGGTFRTPEALFCLVLSLCALLLLPVRRVQLVSIVGVLLVVAAAVGYIHHLALLRNEPERVTYPLFAMIVLWSLSSSQIVSKTSSVKPSALSRFALPVSVQLAVLAAGMLFCVYSTVPAVRRYAAMSEQSNNQRAVLPQIIAELQPKRENLYVIWGEGFPLEYIHPFESTRNYATFHAVWLAWCQRMPSTKAMLAHYGVRDLYAAMYTTNTIKTLLSYNQIISPELRYVGRFARYIKQHYGATVQMRGESGRLLTPVPDLQTANPLTTYFEVEFEVIE